MPQLGVTRLAVEVLGHSARLRRAILILFVLVVETPIEIRRSFVLIWSTVLHHHELAYAKLDGVALEARFELARTYVYLVMSSRMSQDEYS